MEDGRLTKPTEYSKNRKEIKRILGIQGIEGEQLEKMTNNILEKIDQGHQLEKATFDEILAQ